MMALNKSWPMRNHTQWNLPVTKNLIGIPLTHRFAWLILHLLDLLNISWGEIKCVSIFFYFFVSLIPWLLFIGFSTPHNIPLIMGGIDTRMLKNRCIKEIFRKKNFKVTFFWDTHYFVYFRVLLIMYVCLIFSSK